MKEIGGILLLIFSLNSNLSTAQKSRMSREEYIKAYHDFAIQEMNRTGVPASITLAQGILESDCGNSTLARIANNHFGIKCHNNWDGAKVYHDDDEANECFRKYNSVLESYRDHGDFLRNTGRYEFLFNLKPSDYKGWARGLKKAGYATDPRYPELLIKIIEEGYFHQYDVAEVPKKGKIGDRLKPALKDQEETPEPESDFTVDIEPRRIFQRNRVDYIIAKTGDSYDKITRDMNLMSWDIAHFNETTRESPIKAGDPIYLAPKKMRAERGFNVHVVDQGENMHTIAQKYAMRESKLYKLNSMPEGSQPAVGEKLNLRKTRKNEPVVKLR
jgi:hypothetical protein